MSPATTYSELTATARERLSLSRVRPELTGGGLSPEDIRAAGEVHRDLSTALAHLGRTLTRPVAGAPTAQRRAARRRGPDARLMQDLDRRGRGRDWVDPPPQPGTAARDIWEAARAIRAAADLWATHHSGSGAPRSPESSRMRHPALLGAATREWHALVACAGEIAEALLDAQAVQAGEALPAGKAVPHAAGEGQPGPESLGESGTVHLADYPRPAARTEPMGTPVDITVARPTPSRSGTALALLGESVTRIRQGAWSLAESGQAPVPALANMAAIGAALSRAALEAALRGSAPDATPTTRRGATRPDSASAATLRDMHSGWVEACRLLADLRSPHPTTTLLQVERLDMAALLRRVAPDRRPTRPDTAGATAGSDSRTARELAALARRYAEVAGFNDRGLRAAARRGDLYVCGRALPQHLLARRPDLLQAKLDGSVVPAPSSVVTALEDAYRGIARAAPSIQPTDAIRLARDDRDDRGDRDDEARDGSPAA